MIRKILSSLMIGVFLLGVCSCAHMVVINGQSYQPYGLFNQNSVQDPSIEYEPSVGSITFGILGCWLYLIPTIYVFGWDFMQPVGPKTLVKYYKKTVRKEYNFNYGK